MESNLFTRLSQIRMILSTQKKMWCKKKN